MASPFQTLPDDVLQRLLAGVPLDDHQAAAATCQAFRAVIRGPRFLALRQTYGFAERGVVVIEANVAAPFSPAVASSTLPPRSLHIIWHP